MLGLCALWAAAALAQVTDPGVRKTSADGKPPAALPGLSPEELMFFQDGLARFMEVDMVTGKNEQSAPTQLGGRALTRTSVHPVICSHSWAARVPPQIRSTRSSTPWGDQSDALVHCA
jgi:hypothetical protein